MFFIGFIDTQVYNFTYMKTKCYTNRTAAIKHCSRHVHMVSISYGKHKLFHNFDIIKIFGIINNPWDNFRCAIAYSSQYKL